jgi:hypothetical protein
MTPTSPSSSRSLSGTSVAIPDAPGPAWDAKEQQPIAAKAVGQRSLSGSCPPRHSPFSAALSCSTEKPGAPIPARPLDTARLAPGQRKAVALLSGGLDSLLAVRLILEQGIHVEALNFFTGFCVEGHTHAIRQRSGDKPKRNNALWAAEQLGIKLHIIDVIDDY